MGKFTRVSEHEALPSSLNKFASTELQTEDQFADLIAGQRVRQAQVARDTVDIKRERKLLASNTNDWEKIPQAATYEQPVFRPSDENVQPIDLMGQAIRRVVSSQEEDLNARLNPADFGLMERSREELLQARVATMHNPEVFEMTDYLNASMEDHGYFDTMSSEEKRARKLSEWQTVAHAHVIRERKTVTARANPILLHKSGQSVVRIGMDEVADGRFGLPDKMSDLINNEKQRAEMRRIAKDEKDAIKSKHILDPETKHNIWQDNVQQRATTAQEHSSSWLDRYADTVEGN